MKFQTKLFTVFFSNESRRSLQTIKFKQFIELFREIVKWESISIKKKLKIVYHVYHAKLRDFKIFRISLGMWGRTFFI